MQPSLVGFLQKSQILQKIPRWVWVVAALALIGLFILTGGGLTPASGSTPAAGPTSPEAASSLTLTGVLDVYLKLGVVIALLYGGVYVFRRWQVHPLNRSRRRMTVLETTRLTPRQAIHLVKIGTQVLVIGATDQSLATLAEFSLAEADLEPDAPQDTSDEIQLPTLQGLPSASSGRAVSPAFAAWGHFAKAIRTGTPPVEPSNPTTATPEGDA